MKRKYFYIACSNRRYLCVMKMIQKPVFGQILLFWEESVIPADTAQAIAEVRHRYSLQEYSTRRR